MAELTDAKTGRTNIDEVFIRGNAVVESVSTFLETAKTNPDSADGYMACGKVNEVSGDLYVAIAWYERALGVNPDLHEARCRLAAAQLKNGQKQDAMRTAIEVTSMAPDFVFTALVRGRPISAMSLLGDALRESGYKDEAMDAYRRALNYVPEDMYAAGHYGTLLLQNGNIEEAMEVLKKIDPENGIFGPVSAAARLAERDPALLPAIRESYVDWRLAGEVVV
jgi:tetratricopeptide (TPR) repeat protein